LNAANKPCDANGNELVFAAEEVDTSASNSGYLDLDADAEAEADAGPAIKLKK
jgi:hypothetical protein